MEPATQFDLEARVRQWNEALAAQPGVTLETRRELETHLRETVEELRGLGLNLEEAFWLACRRTGPPLQLGEEFAKANPPSVWKTRLLWVAAALLAMRLAQGAVAGLVGAMAWCQIHYGADPLRLWWVDGLQNALQYSELGGVSGAFLVICVAVFIASRSPGISEKAESFFFGSRLRFALTGGLAVLAMFSVEHWSATMVLTLDSSYRGFLAADAQGWRGGFLSPVISGMVSGNLMNGWREVHLEPQFSAALVMLITWLIPSESGFRRRRVPQSLPG